MPKRGRGNNRQWPGDGDNRGPRDSRHEGRKYYFEHDQRGADLTRRVSFKAGTSNRIGKNRRPDWDKTLQSRLGVLDEDVDMAAGQSGSGNTRRIIISNNGYKGGRGRGRGGSRGGRQGSPPGLPRKLTEGPSWYQIRIPHGHKYEKTYILEALQSHIAPLQLVPFLYLKSPGDASFYVDSYQVADKLHQADRQITTAEGYKLLTRVRPGFPPVTITDAIKEKIKLAMSTRYNHHNKSLDLEKFHMDPHLLDSAVALFRPNIMLECVDIVAANIPDIQAVSLTDNMIGMVSHLSVLATKLPSLNILHLGKNLIRDIRQLESFKDLQLIEIVLDGNPLCDKFKDRSAYVSQVTERFPKLRKLDGVELLPPIQFETEEEIALPENNGSFFINQDGRPFVRQFLEQYMLIYDADDRTPLKAAYHEQAAFSMTSAPLADTVHMRLDSYIPVSRNLLRVKDPIRRHKFLHKGRDAIVHFLGELPATTHDPVSFAVDMPIYTPQLIQVCVTGIYRERGDPTREPAMRCFSRVFVIVPVGAGFCIINESFFVTNVTAKQQQCAFVAPTPSALPGVELKTQMVHALQENTKMNITWANKCLEETNWNYELALGSFNQLQKVNAIPPEAFVIS